MEKTLLVAAGLFASTQAFSQAAFPPPPPKVSPAAVSDADIDTMMRKNPARLLGLN